MLIITVIIFCLTLVYICLMVVYRLGWDKQRPFELPAVYEPKTPIVIIIPARNEANNISACVQSILAQNYPAHLFRIVVIDDHSTDNTFDIVTEFKSNVHCIKLADHMKEGELITAFKKKALSVGIAYSTEELIITTDADCIASPGWLRQIAAIYEREQPVMIIAPVDFTNNNSLVQLFQSIDFMSMQGITAAAHIMKLGNMSNGANFAFSRHAYNVVEGYKGIDHLASGDDYLLMMKVEKTFPGKISYLKSKEAIVSTLPQPDWGSFIQQRVRWASKTGKYKDNKLTAILTLVYLFNFSFLVVFASAIFYPFLFITLGFMLLWKVLAELYFIIPVASFFNKRKQLKYFILLQPLHIGYIIVAGFLGFVGVYKWKGRVSR